jgi:uncharacterized protein YbcI
MSSKLLTQGEVEAQIGSALGKLYAELFSRGPKSIQVNMLPSSAVIVTQNTFTAAELQIMSPAGFHDDYGRQMFKDMRSRIILANRESLTKIIEKATGVAVTCLHHDMSALTGEEAFVFSLQDRPDYRANHTGNGRAKGRFVCH